MAGYLQAVSRRRFLEFVAASPCAASFASEAWAQADTALIASPAEALNVFDFEEVAHRKVQAGHWAYMSSGVDGDVTLRANREGFSHLELRPRRLRDATKVDMRVELFGTVYDSPIFTCPTGGEKSFHPDGELGVSRAAKAKGTLQILSTSSSTGVEDVNAALGRPCWYQLYAPPSWEACERILERVSKAGCKVVLLTVDNTTGRNSETYLRMRPKDLRQCAACHKGDNPGAAVSERKMYDGIDMSAGTQNPAMDWVFLDRLRKAWKGQLLIKGIDTAEDAKLALDHGLDGILVSNHGGRSTETGRATIEALPEVVGAVNGRIPVLLDGGVRRGTDVFKALALGAKAVGIGRPMLWGLGAFGQAGVERVLTILQAELKLTMGNCGTQKLADITRAYVASSPWPLR